VNSKLLVKRALFPGTDVATRQRLARFAPHFRAGDVETLDVGCGNGAFSFAAYGRGNRVLGIDRNADNIQRCQEYAAFVGIDESRCRFEVANVYELDTAASFDQVIAFEILEHLTRDDDVVALLGRLLRTGGLLHASSPYLHRRPYVGEVVSDAEDGGHVRLGYTFERLDELMRAAGLEPTLHDTAVGPSSRTVLETINRAEARAGRAAGVAALLALLPLTMLDRLPGRLAIGRALILYAQGTRRE
jgi:SAM-dependent methyltransferase